MHADTTAQTRRTRLTAVLIGTVALAAALCAPASALDDTKPTPSCAGPAFSDPTGDAAAGLVGPAIFPVGDNLDLTGGFFKYDGDTVTANIVVKNLDQSLPPYALGIGWYMHYTQGSAVKFVDADIDITGALTFNYGTLDTGYTTEGSTKGKLFEGENGIVQIQLPGGAALDGSTLKSPYAAAKVHETVPGVGGILANADDAPDSQSGTAFNVVPCGGGPAENALGIRLVGTAPKASKAKKTLALTITSGNAVENVAAKLLKGKTTYATGKAKIVDGDTKLSLKVRKKLRKGSYVLALTGTTADGKKSARIPLKLR